MNWTNKQNLPLPLCRAIEKQNTHGKRDPMRIPVTALIGSPLLWWLRSRYEDTMDADYSDRIWQFLGSIGHMICEEAADKASGEHAELKMTAVVDGVTVVGMLDHISTDDSITDYKLASVYTVKDGARTEWIEQQNVYLKLLRMNPETAPMAERIKSLRICAILRDWGPRHEREVPRPVVMLDLPVWTDQMASDFLAHQVAAHKPYIGSDTPPPICDERERWTSPRVFAVMKKGRASSLKNCLSFEEAQAWIKANGKGDNIEERPGEDKRCNEYCEYSKQGKCPYRQAKAERKDGNE